MASSFTNSSSPVTGRVLNQFLVNSPNQEGSTTERRIGRAFSSLTERVLTNLIAVGVGTYLLFAFSSSLNRPRDVRKRTLSAAACFGTVPPSTAPAPIGSAPCLVLTTNCLRISECVSKENRSEGS